MQYDYKSERTIELMATANILREFGYLRELIIPRPLGANDPLVPPDARAYGFGISKNLMRVWFTYDHDKQDGKPRSAIGRLICPRTVGYLGRPTGNLRVWHKATARAKALAEGRAVPVRWWERLWSFIRGRK